MTLPGHIAGDTRTSSGEANRMTKKKQNKEFVRPEDRKLTARQAAFVRMYTSAGKGFYNGRAAAAKAGYKGTNAVLAVVAHQNLRKLNIIKAIKAGFRDTAKGSTVTVDKVLDDIELARIHAMRVGNYGAALRASELHGKYLRMWLEKIEHVHTLDDVSTEDLFAMAKTLMEELDGFNFDGGTGRTAETPAPKRDPTKPETTH